MVNKQRQEKSEILHMSMDHIIDIKRNETRKSSTPAVNYGCIDKLYMTEVGVYCATGVVSHVSCLFVIAAQM